MAGYKPIRFQAVRLREALEELRLLVESVDPTSPLSGEMNRYFMVRVCGYLEQAVMLYARDCAGRHSYGVGQSFALSFLDKSFNPSVGNLRTFVGRFSSAWLVELEDFLKDDERASRVGALVAIRNDVAHGKNRGVSLLDALDYLDLVDDLVDWIDARLGVST